MQRRKFLRNAAATAVAIPVLNGLSMKAYGQGSYLEEFYTDTVQTNHVLVVIQLSGGNDGLNMVIPLDQYSAYQAARPNIALQQDKILGLGGTPFTAATGLHPSLSGLYDLYNDGHLNIIQSVGYPTPNFSHFRQPIFL